VARASDAAAGPEGTERHELLQRVSKQTVGRRGPLPYEPTPSAWR